MRFKTITDPSTTHKGLEVDDEWVQSGKIQFWNGTAWQDSKVKVAEPKKAPVDKK